MIPSLNGVNRLLIYGVTLLSIDDVDAWLFAIDMPQSQRKEACRQIMSEGYYGVSNIEYKVTVECSR